MTDEEKLKYYHYFANDIGAFAKFFFPHILVKEIPDFHREIYKDLLHTGFYACAAPRGSAKSTLGLIIKPIHFALFNRLGSITMLSASEDFIVNEISRVIMREFEQNEILRAFFGDLKTSKWSVTYFVLKNGIAFEGGGIGGQLRGGRRGLICLDDLESNETVESEEQRIKLKDRVYKELVPKLLPGGQMIYMGTIIHRLAFLKQILDTPNNGWVKKLYKAYKNDIEAPGNELWADMMPHDELQRRKALMGSNAFQSEYQNNPISDETAPIKQEHIRYWEELPKQYSAVIAVDPAYSEDDTADYKVATLNLIDSQSNRYLSHYIRTHQPIGEFQDAIINLWLQNKNCVTAIGIPNSGTEKAFFDSFLRKCEQRKLYPPVVELKNSFTSNTTQVSHRNKKSRIIAALQPLFEQGKYYLHPNHYEAVDELLTLGQSKHDDLVDCMAYSEQLLQPVFIDSNQTEDHNQEQVSIPANYGMG